MIRRTNDGDEPDDGSSSDGEYRGSEAGREVTGSQHRRDFLKAGATAGAGAFALGLGERAAAATATDPSNLDVYLLFGQSNMEGAGPIREQDRETHPRIHVTGDLDCPNLGREYGEWYLAEPPLNRCDAGVGPGDYFAKTVIQEMPEERGIGLVPAAVGGADIAFFQKGAPIGRNDRDIPPQFDGGYQWLLDLARKAQQVGTIRGILFHQGETNTGEEDWPSVVGGIVENLRSDLGIGNVPFLAGEMRYDSQGGCCASHNELVDDLPNVIPNAHVVSAEGLAGQDYAHFTTAAYRKFGRRYAEAMLEHVDVGGDGTGGTGGDSGGGSSGDSGGDSGGGSGGSGGTDGSDGSTGGSTDGTAGGSGDLVAEIDPSTTSASTDDLVQFNVNDTTGPATWLASLEWDLGNGTTATGWYADERYQSAGSYTVALTATNNEGASTTHEVTVQVT